MPKGIQLWDVMFWVCLLFFGDFFTGMTSAMKLLFSYALIIHTIFSRFNSWVAEAMGVKFLAQGNNSTIN